MKIDHVALWADDIERLKEFYVRYFNATAGDEYVNPVRKFRSYFLTFSDSPIKLEIMNIPGLTGGDAGKTVRGYCHIAISTGSKEKVDELTDQLRSAGTSIVSNPRTTGDGYYESVVTDPEGNIIEITV